MWAVPGPPVHEKRTPTAADAHDLKIVVKLRAVPTSKVPFPVEIAGFPDFSRPVPVYPAFLKYVVPVQEDHEPTVMAEQAAADEEDDDEIEVEIIAAEPETSEEDEAFIAEEAAKIEEAEEQKDAE